MNKNEHLWQNNIWTGLELDSNIICKIYKAQNILFRDDLILGKLDKYKNFKV